MGLRVVISAGEVSGDRHLAKVVRVLRQRQPECEVEGMGGRECAQAGARLVVDCYRTGATMGFSGVVGSAKNIVASFRRMSRLIKDSRPDVVVLVDYPDFNLRLAKVAHHAGSKVLYYIPPKVWAWRSGRVETIKRYVDQVAAIFPFEKPFFEKRGYHSVVYVGHPLGVRIGSERRDRDYTLLMLPGSRSFEVERLLPPMLRVFERLRQTRTTLQGKVVVAPNMEIPRLCELANSVVSQETVRAISWSQEDSIDAMKTARAGILKSGTCNLEGAVAGLPFVSVYSGSWVNKVIVSALVSLPEYSPVNIIKSGTVREVFGVCIDEALLEREVAKVLDDGADRERMVADFKEVQRALSSFDSGLVSNNEGDVPGRVAQLVLGLAPDRSSMGCCKG